MLNSQRERERSLVFLDWQWESIRILIEYRIIRTAHSIQNPALTKITWEIALSMALIVFTSSSHSWFGDGCLLELTTAISLMTVDTFAYWAMPILADVGDGDVWRSYRHRLVCPAWLHSIEPAPMKIRHQPAAYIRLPDSRCDPNVCHFYCDVNFYARLD